MEKKFECEVLNIYIAPVKKNEKKNYLFWAMEKMQVIARILD